MKRSLLIPLLTVATLSFASGTALIAPGLAGGFQRKTPPKVSKRVVKTPAKIGAAVLTALPKGLAAVEKVLGPSKPYAPSWAGSRTLRRFKVSGYSEVYAEIVGGQIDGLSMQLEDRSATWKEFFAIFGLPTTGLKWTDYGDGMYTDVAGVPEGWDVSVITKAIDSKAFVTIGRKKG